MKNVIAFIAVAILFWHIKVFFNSTTEISGPFQVTPKPGYTWNDGGTASKMFWEGQAMHWTPGAPYPGYHVQADRLEGYWDAMPGYVLTHPTVAGDFSTTWQSGLKHPKHNIISTTQEGMWTPMIGYKWVSTNTENLEVAWRSGLRYQNLKIISGDQKDTWYAFPGYEFTNPQKSLEVAWKPGLGDPMDSTLIAGDTEGTWVKNTEPTFGDHVVASGLSYAAANLFEWISGHPTALSKYLRDQTEEQGWKAVGSLIKK